MVQKSLVAPDHLFPHIAFQAVTAHREWPRLKRFIHLRMKSFFFVAHFEGYAAGNAGLSHGEIVYQCRADVVAPMPFEYLRVKKGALV